ncbi:hypothetical protein [Mucilaginibacter sp. KACC 22063]|uniref:hypothetical protein n=1 Tax=Mucilaginibacter sp. KACC 22063 TaxID=3025666 RepID=UPI0023663AB2|nr:hypothetical protein [Mucilaginibacter sp. KACC 22063]WDF56896.1 hypothetical protein PQ461_07485 [Mucilaginibacter sp. KACC 22063]
MKENQKKAFDFAAETTKQLITIATAIITLTVTFSKDILGGAQESTKTFLIWTWGVFIVSIIMGIGTLMALTGRLLPMNKNLVDQTPPSESNQPDNVAATITNQEAIPNANSITSSNTAETLVDNTDDIHINHRNIRFFSISQALLFCLAIIMTGVFGYKSLHIKLETKSKNAYKVIRKSILNDDTATIYIDTLYLKK